MRKLLMASAAILGATSGLAFAQTPANPSQGQLIAPYGAGPAVNNNNNAWGVANTPSGAAAAGPLSTVCAERGQGPGTGHHRDPPFAMDFCDFLSHSAICPLFGPLLMVWIGIRAACMLLERLRRPAGKECLRPGPDDGDHAVIPMLTARSLEYADLSVPLPNFDLISSGIILRFCDGLLIAVAVKISRVDNSILVVEKKQTIVCHSLLIIIRVLRAKLTS